MNNTKIEWLDYAKTTPVSHGKAFFTAEKGRAIVLEWKRVDIVSQDLANFKKDLSELASEKIYKSELEFLKVNPEALSSELFLMACKPLIDSDPENVDWHKVQETIKTSVKQFYLADLSIFGPDVLKPLLNDIYFCATLRNENEKDR